MQQNTAVQHASCFTTQLAHCDPFLLCHAPCKTFHQWLVIAQNKASDTQGSAKLDLWADAPRWEYSTAPLADANGRPLDAPQAGAGGSAMYLSDQQASSHLHI